jgi:hypothetical protein
METGVLPWSVIVGSAAFSSSALAIPARPRMHALQSAMMPRWSRALMVVAAMGWSRSHRTVSRCPRAVALSRGVQQLKLAMAGSAPICSSSRTTEVRPYQLAKYKAV